MEPNSLPAPLPEVFPFYYDFKESTFGFNFPNFNLIAFYCMFSFCSFLLLFFVYFIFPSFLKQVFSSI